MVFSTGKYFLLNYDIRLVSSFVKYTFIKPAVGDTSFYSKKILCMFAVYR